MNMKRNAIKTGICFALTAGCAATAVAQTGMDRTVLPIPEPKHPHNTVLDVRNSPSPPPRFEVKAPAGAPNVLIVLIDDFGFGQSSAVGGPIPMPTAERLANNGLKYNTFHTCALSSPSRSGLLTGRNHHTTNTGSVMETATAFPGNTGQRPESVAPLATMLSDNGSTPAAFGARAVVAEDVEHKGVVELAHVGYGVDETAGFIIGLCGKACKNLHLTAKELLFIRAQFVPVLDASGLGRKLRTSRDNAQLDLAGERLLPQLVPALVELTLESGNPFLWHLVRCVRRARCVVDEAGLVRS